MPKYEANMAGYDKVKELLAGLGFSFGKEFKLTRDTVDVAVKHGSKKVARLSFYLSTGGGYASLRVLPPDAEAYSIMAGHGHIDSDAKMSAALMEVDCLFRTYLVQKRKMAYEDFPSDGVLRTLIAGLVETCGPEGNKRFHPASRRSDAAYQAAKGLAQEFDRPVALRLQRLLAAIDAGDDPSLGYMARCAASCADVPYSRCVVAWETGSIASYLVNGVKPAPERVPLPEDQAATFGM